MKSKGMRNVYCQRGWYYFAKMEKGERVWTNLQTRDPCEAIRKAERLRKRPLIISNNALRRDIEKFIAHKRDLGLRKMKGGYSPRSVKAKAYTLLKFCNWLPPGTSAADVRSEQAEAFHGHLRSAEGLTEHTAIGYMMTLRAFFRWAEETEGLRLDNPVHPVKLPQPGRGSREAWVDAAQRNSLIRNATNDDLRFILHCGFDAGLRRTEIVEARADWFDLKQGFLHVRLAERPPRLREGEKPFITKDGEERTVPLTRPFTKFLKKYLAGRKPLDFALQPEVKHGVADYRYDFRRPFTEYMESQKCAWVTPHVMRHSFASILASMGVSLLKVALWLGDGTRVVEAHYAHLNPADRDIHTLYRRANATSKRTA